MRKKYVKEVSMPLEEVLARKKDIDDKINNRISEILERTSKIKMPVTERFPLTRMLAKYKDTMETYASIVHGKNMLYQYEADFQVCEFDFERLKNESK